MLYVEAGDIFFTKSESLLGKLIRKVETDKGEEPTWANHTGVVVESGWIGNRDPQYKNAVVVEALWKTRKGELQPGPEVAIFRPLEDLDLKRFAETAESFVGATYGWWKLLFHLADRAIFKDKKVLSKMLYNDKRPICSYLVAHVYAAQGIEFGISPDAADPDEMMDYCLNHPYEWELLGFTEA